MADAPTAQVAPTGTLRAVINLGNPVLAQGTPQEPRGVTVAIARAVAEWLGVPLELEGVDAARTAYASMDEGRADLCFLANEPSREEHVAFTAPYVVIEGVYVVAGDSPLTGAAEVDRGGMRIGVREGSAYDLFLTRSLGHAEVVRADEATDVFEEQRLDARRADAGFEGRGGGGRCLSGHHRIEGATVVDVGEGAISVWDELEKDHEEDHCCLELAHALPSA